MEKRSRGRPKKLSRKEFEQFVFDYFDYIYNSQKEDNSDVPTLYGFYRYVNEVVPCAYKTIQRCFNEYCPDIKKDFEEMRSNLLVRGTSLGKYQPTIVIFALKNWCHWKDNPTDTSINADDIRQDELSKSLEEMAKELESDD